MATTNTTGRNFPQSKPSLLFGPPRGTCRWFEETDFMGNIKLQCYPGVDVRVRTMCVIMWFISNCSIITKSENIGCSKKNDSKESLGQPPRDFAQKCV